MTNLCFAFVKLSSMLFELPLPESPVQELIPYCPNPANFKAGLLC